MTTLTILESIIAFAINFPKNLNLEQISSTTLNLVLGPRGTGNNPTGLCTYSASPEPSESSKNNQNEKSVEASSQANQTLSLSYVPYSRKLFEEENFHVFWKLKAIHESFLREIWGCAAPTYDWFQVICESFLCKILTSYRSTKVFSLESLLLYGIYYDEVYSAGEGEKGLTGQTK